MKYSKLVFFVALLVLTMSVVSACGGGAAGGGVVVGGGSAQPITLNDVPVYQNAKLLNPGENPMADSLAKNVQQAAGMGQKLDQKVFSLPKDATWDPIKSYYADKLGSSGWQSINLPAAAAANDMMQMSIWKRGTQSLTVAHLKEPISNESFLMFSLSSQ